MHIQAHPDTFLDTFESVNAIVDECRMYVTEDAVKIQGIDKAEVGMVDLILTEDDFQSFDGDNRLFGISIGELISEIKAIEKEPLENGEIESISIEFNEQETQLELSSQQGTIESAIALIDPNSITKRPDVPEFDYSGIIIARNKWMSYLFDYWNGKSDALEINGDENTIDMVAKGDTDRVNVDLTEDHEAIRSIQSTPHSVIAPLKVLDAIGSGTPDTGNMILKTHSDAPIGIDFEFEDLSAELNFKVAPRIPENGSNQSEQSKAKTA